MVKTLKILLPGLLMGLVVVMAFSTPVAPAGVLPPLPDSVMTNLGWSHVAIVENPTCGDSTAIAFGCSNMETRNIEIRRSLGRQTAWQALEHEKAHLMFFDGSIVIRDPAMLERLCDLIGNTRVQERLAELGR